MSSVDTVLKKLKDDRSLNSSNIIEKIKEEFYKKIGDAKYKEEYVSWEKSKFSIDHPFEMPCYNEFKKASLFFIAVMYSHFKIARYLNDAGADINVLDNELKTTPLHVAVTLGNIGMTELLLKAGAKVNVVDNIGRIPLFYAKDEFIEKLLIKALRKSNNVNFVDGYGDTPLHYVKDTNSLKMLIRKGAKVTAVNNSGRIALYYAEEDGEKLLVEALCKSNNVNFVDGYGDTPLHYVKDTNSLKMLIRKGAKVNIKNKYGQTPLCNMVMSSKYDENMLLTMLEHGADPWSRPGFLGVIRLLLEIFRRPEDDFKTLTQSLRFVFMVPVNKYCFLLKESKKYKKGDDGPSYLSSISEVGEAVERYRSFPDDRPKYFLKLSEANNKARRFVRNPTLVLDVIVAAILFRTEKITVNVLNIIVAVVVVISVAIAAHYAAYEVFKPSLKVEIADLEKFASQQSAQPSVSKQLNYEALEKKLLIF